MNINIIVAYCKNRGIGLNNQMPWLIPEDLKRFAEITKGNGNNAVIMGKNTYNSIGFKLAKRFNIVLSTKEVIPDVTTCATLELALKVCKEKKFDEVFIIGGQSVYEEVLNKKLVHKIYVTEINKEYKCDTFFPTFSEVTMTSFEKQFSETAQIELFYKTFDLTGCKCCVHSKIEGKLVLPTDTS